ncbi:TagK domain-containing protein [Trinickia sp. YCB016]
MLQGTNGQAIVSGNMRASLSADLEDSGSHGSTNDDLNNSDAVFGVIGSAVVDRIAASDKGDFARSDDGTLSPGDSEPARDLLATLQEQYWRALDDPQASLVDQWEMREAGMPVQLGDGIVNANASQQEFGADWSGMESIETMLSAERGLEDYFGPLRTGEPALDLEAESATEVLRLFAPPEYHAAAARRPPRLPPELTRREHHTLSVDSPLFAPSRDHEE